MTLNREMVPVTVTSYVAGVDEYGQTRQLGSSQRTVEMVLKQRNVADIMTNPDYADVTVEGITADRDITDADTIEYNGCSYGIKYIIPSKRFLTLMMFKR